MKSILFVCTGNTCRSPLAEGLFKKMLTRIFHTDCDEEAVKADGIPPAVGRPRGRLPLGRPERMRRASPSESTQTNILTPGCMGIYGPSHNVSLTQNPSGFPVSAVDEYEICGLTSHHQFAVTSAGLHAMEGMPANPHTLEVLREQGIDFSLFRSQRVTAALIEQATHVFLMTHSHLREISTLHPDYQKKFFLLNEGTTQDDVTDPIGGSLAAYQECGQRIQQALENILMLINKNVL